ncbi:glycosyltransferase [Sphingomonas sp. MMS24-J13]|uniref:glycosyltransferase n=1 Tax=Sphingomonas sp. MMS24-J13 TaxID=3238686 RepID=UPI00384B7817
MSDAVTAPETIRNFDPLWYSSEYPDVVLSNLSPQEHYRRYGKALGRTLDAKRQTVSPPIDRPKVSVVCICYNQERFIEQTIRSILSQIVAFPIEIIVVDDCSTDRTPSLIEPLIANDPRAKFIARTTNVGSPQNFGDALALARGEYVAICEGDDYWTDDRKLQLQVDFLDENQDCSICFHPVVVEYEGDQKSEIFPPDTGPFHAHRLAFGNFIQTNSVMYRWRWAEGEFARSYSPAITPSDWYLHLQHAEIGGIGFINRPMAVYRKHSGGIWWGAGSLVHRLRYGSGEIAFFRGLGTLFGGAFAEHCAQVRAELAFQLSRHYIVNDDHGAFRRLLDADHPATLVALDQLGFRFTGSFADNDQISWADLVSLPLISVIVLTYNHATTIEECLRSVICQQGPFNIELIIGDDFSKDETCNIIDRVFAQAKPGLTVKFFRAESNMGMQANLRRCLDAATGEYVAFCEGDDYWLSPLKIIKQVLCLQGDLSLSMCFNWILLENQVDNSLTPHPQQEQIYGSILSQQEIFENPITANFSCCMYRASSLSEIDDRYYATRGAADWLFNLFATERGQIGFIRELLSVYRIHSGGQWSKLLPTSQKATFAEAQRLAKATLGSSLKVGKYSIETYERRLPAPLLGCLDQPQQGATDLRHGRLDISGWVVDDRNRKINLVIKHGRERYLIDLNQPRMDVPVTLGLDNADPKCGFHISFSPHGEGMIDIEVQAGESDPIPWQRIRYVFVLDS